MNCLVQVVVFLAAISFLVVVSHAVPAEAAERADLSAHIRFIPEPVKSSYTIGQAVETAIRNFPSIRSARYKLYASRADITLAKTEYLPVFNLLVQEMRNSQNVISSTVLPQTLDVIPIPSGTVSKSSKFSSIWGDDMGANFSWLLYDFGLRHADVMLSKANTSLAQQVVRLTELDVAYAAADAFLTTVAATETIIAAQATLDRAQAAAITIHTMVDRGMRPGVDAARVDYEVSQAKIAVIRAQQATELARVDLAEKMGVAGTYINISYAPIVRTPSRRYDVGPTDFETHPLASVRTAAVKSAAAKVHVLDRTWYPHLWLNSAIWGRGSGAGGESPPVAGGVVPQVANWAAGLSVSFPVLDVFEVKARRKRAYNEQLAEVANYDLAIQILEQQDARSRVLLEKSRSIASETPTLVKAAKENEIKTLERYKVGLDDMVAVAEAEKLLARAEVEDAIAQVEVWRSILAAGYVHGSLKPFQSLISAAEGAGG